MKKISIIIPVYNRERHLEECVDSILLSIENDVEIIIVDDGSTDRTPEICDKLKKKSDCIKVIHQTNKGVANARNTGLSAASGEWIAWVDSDDLVSASYIRTLKKCIASIDTDIIIFEYATFTNSNDVSIKMPISNNIIEIRKEECFEALGDISVGNFLWNKLFRRKLFEGITFPDGKVYEDIATTYRVLDKAKKIILLTSKIYFYRQHSDSIVHRTNGTKALKMLQNRVEAHNELVKFLKGKYPAAFEIQNKLLIKLAFEYIKAEETLKISPTPTYIQCRDFIRGYKISIKRDGIKLCAKVIICNNAFPIYKLIFRLHG